MKKLHHKQEELLRLLKNHINEPLTMLELSREAGINSPGVLYHHLQQLVKKGLLKRNPSNPKDYTVLDSPEKAVAYLNKYGLAQCGPSGQMLDEVPVAKIPISTSILRFPASEAFIVEAKGNSMEPKIFEGDLLIVRKDQNPSEGEIILCIHNEKAIIKQYLRIGKRIVLNSFNQQEKLIEAEEDLVIVGTVKNIIHYS